MPTIGLAELAIVAVIAVTWAIPILLIVLGVRWVVQRSSRGPAEDSALAILRDRYARGEIDATEYEERRRTLTV